MLVALIWCSAKASGTQTAPEALTRSGLTTKPPDSSEDKGLGFTGFPGARHYRLQFRL